MESPLEFKFSPWYVCVLFSATCITGIGWYVIYHDKTALGTSLFLFLLPIFIGWTAVPVFFKLIRGIPAIVLTDKGIIDNTRNFSIEWKDISEITSITTARGGEVIAIKLKQRDKYINTTLKKFSYSIGRIYTKCDILIYLSLIENDKLVFYSIQTKWLEYSSSREDAL